MQDSCLMKPSLFPWLLAALLALFSGLASAERADRNKPMNVEADALRYDEAKQTSVFTGRVVLTKGTIVIRGEKIDVRQDADGNQFGLVTAEPGKLAFFRQKREALEEFIEGEGQTIEYDGRADTVKFISKAQLRRYRGATLADELAGAVIVYNNTTDVFNIEGSMASSPLGAASGRVRAVLTPTPEAESQSRPKPGSVPLPSPALRATTTLGGEKK
jgi:lipopolysaccharide export system protein LptA